MTTQTYLFNPSKYHRMVELNCNAAVYSDSRWRQCHRKATTLGKVQGVPSPLCSRHVKGSNVAAVA